jgi:transcriptional regulator with XRE-family HTH domain
MTPLDEPRRSLARRLRALRLRHWADHRIKQDDLAAALGVKASSVSTWESLTKPKIPPVDRIEAYATFFATERSIKQMPHRVLRLEDLDQEELDQRAELLRELSELRNAAAGLAATDGAVAGAEEGHRSLWHFPENEDIRIVCARLSRRLLDRMPYADSSSPDYVDIYTYADPDALIEAFGHIRALNPRSNVQFRVGSNLTADDYMSHLVLLGGVDWNDATRDVLHRFEKLPVKQFSRDTEAEPGGFEVVEDGRRREFAPRLRTVDGRHVLEEDIAHVVWAPNPYNDRRTVTICNGMYGRGVYGAVRAITHDRFRTENENYVRSRFGGGGFSILSRVLVADGNVVTPNWSAPENRLHEWSVTG